MQGKSIHPARLRRTSTKEPIFRHVFCAHRRHSAPCHRRQEPLHLPPDICQSRETQLLLPILHGSAEHCAAFQCIAAEDIVAHRQTAAVCRYEPFLPQGRSPPPPVLIQHPIMVWARNLSDLDDTISSLRPPAQPTLLPAPAARPDRKKPPPCPGQGGGAYAYVTVAPGGSSPIPPGYTAGPAPPTGRWPSDAVEAPGAAAEPCAFPHCPAPRRAPGQTDPPW